MQSLAGEKRFSFFYGGKGVFSLPLKEKVTQNGSETVYEYITEDGLKFTNICKFYEDFDAVEWVIRFENTADTDSKLLSQIYDCDICLPFEHDDPMNWATAYLPDKDKGVKVYAPSGSPWIKGEFYCDADELAYNRYINHMYPGEVREYKTTGGRSSQAQAPFFNVSRQNKGVIFAIGWTGQWNCSISRSCDSLEIKSGIEKAEFYLLPHEKIRTSSFVIMNYEGSVEDSQNKWRRLVKKHFSLVGSKGREAHGPLCAGVWGGMTSKGVLDRIELIKKEQLPFEYIWMDAGWYGGSVMNSPDEYEGDWAHYTGDWEVNKTHHPSGMLDVAEAIKAAGLKFLLWFEPERVVKGTRITSEHPEYFISSPNEQDPNLLLNLGDEAAWNYCFDTVSDIIERLSIKFYRQDFNFDPLDKWRKNDSAGRCGITEIKHIMGLYRLWDALLERFPDLMIDDCASGGRRIDIEMLRRSMPLWRSDVQCPANNNSEFTQAHNMQYGAWMPYSGTGSGRDMGDVYRIRSAYGGSMNLQCLWSERDAMPGVEQAAWLKRYLAEYLSIREYFYGDLYPLTGSMESEYSWNAAQYNRPESGDGMITAFRHEKSPFAAAAFKLKGIKTDKIYRVTDLDDNSFIDILGEILIKEGLEVKTSQPRQAKIYIYKIIKE